MLKVYIISGCCGAGKTTLTKELIKEMPRTALIHGDRVHDLFGTDLAAEWPERLKLTWENVLLLTDNFLRNNANVIIDYVVEEAYELEQILSVVKNYAVEVRYIVLTADEATIKERIIQRSGDWLVERALFLRNKIINCEENEPYLYDGSKDTIAEQIEVVKNFKPYFYSQ